MKLKKLELCGFKSFVDRTVLLFDRDITCIVGPNGCGKSNVVDAIRWVMGEQSAKHLRGKGMEDVIFSGSDSRAAVDFAEVSLTFDNTHGLAPAHYADYPEITITRRLERQGDSHYLINKTPVRLMDVTELFLGTGAGRKAYSIIEQGRVGYIVSAKPEDRRLIIEEAAGITKFKAKKRAAERKMEQTQQNLLRVNDILGELERTLASLSRQAQKTERYKAYKKEQRDIDLWVASHRFLELTTKRAHLKGALEEALRQTEAQRTSLTEHEARLDAERIEAQLAAKRLDELNQQRFESDQLVSSLEANSKNQLVRIDDLREAVRHAEREISDTQGRRDEVAKEQAELQTVCDTLQTELAALEDELAQKQQRFNDASERRQAQHQALQNARTNQSTLHQTLVRTQTLLETMDRRKAEEEQRLVEIEKESEELRTTQQIHAQALVESHSELSELETRREALKAQLTALQEKLSQLTAQLHQSEQNVDAARKIATEHRSKLASIEELKSRLEGVQAGVRAVVSNQDALFGDNAAGAGEELSHSVLGLVADRIECEPEWNHALASALGQRVQYVVVDDLSKGLVALDALRERGLGRATIISQSTPSIPPGADDIAHEPGVIGRLIDKVRFSDADRPLVERLLARVWLVASVPDALRLRDQVAYRGCLVTQSGELITTDGAVTGGTGEQVAEHLLELNQRIRTLEHDIVGSESALSEALAIHSQLRDELLETQKQLETARNDAHALDLAWNHATHRKSVDENKTKELDARLVKLNQTAQELSAALEQAESERQSARFDHEQASAELAQLDSELARLTELVTEVEAQSTAAQEDLMAFKVRESALREKCDAQVNALTRMNNVASGLAEHLERLTSEIAHNHEQEGTITTQYILIEEALGHAVHAAIVASEKLEAERTRHEQAQTLINELDQNVRALREVVTQAQQSEHQLELGHRECELALASLSEKVREQYREEIGLILVDYHHRVMPTQENIERSTELQRLIERMGEINLTAIEEHKEQSERYETLKTQRDDLVEALSQLESAIRKMNRESKIMFKETFDAVNQRFSQLFPKLFGGGKAELRLTNPDDLMESGVELFAMPPGKKISAIELMSGGEKALTAVALIMAIFQFKPSPFCLMDEVDAPLDEANIARFNEAVRHMTDRSQFILISHSRRTMEMADVLYGVTMETPGISKLVTVELRKNAPKEAKAALEQQASA